MNYSTILGLICFSLCVSCSSSNYVVNVPAQQHVTVDDKGYLSYEATLKNKSFSDLNVAVLNKETNEQMSGFGLGKKAKVDVIVNQEGKLVLNNPNDKDVNVSISYSEMEAEQILDPINSNEYVSFSLMNNTAKSIPLLIPSVMNPNLSPFSRSGVDLKYGQKILFRHKGKRYTLLVVDESIKNGDKIKVGDLLKQRKKELGL